MTESPNRTYLPPIDHLRAFAALLIVFYHGFHVIGSPLARGLPFSADYWPASVNPIVALIIEGHTAVALFMVLSGFILTIGVYGQDISYRRFITNRVLRIYPLYVFLLFAGVSFQPSGFTLLSFMQSLLPLSNLPGAFAAGSITAVSWTISVEFQFYLIFPFLVVLLYRRGTKYVIGLVATLIAFRLVGALLNLPVRDPAYWTIIGRLDQFLIGMVAARFALTPARRDLGRGFPVAAALVLALVWGFHRAGGWPVEAPWKLLWPTVEGAAWAAFIVTYLDAAKRMTGIPSRLLVFVGARSYSIYLLHMIIVTTTIDRGWFVRVSGTAYIDAIVTTVVVVLPGTLALSSLTYAAIERPFLGLRRSYVAAPSAGGPAPR